MSGWGIKKISRIKTFSHCQNVYSLLYVFSYNSKKYVLKRSNIVPLEKQRGLADLITFLYSNDIKVPKQYRTIKKELYYVDGKGVIYSLSSFVIGNLFSGSKKELISAAKSLAQMHLVLDKFPYTEYDQVFLNKPYPVNLRLIPQLFSRVNEGKSKYDIQAREMLNIIGNKFPKNIEILKSISFQKKQVCHFDFHPYNLIFSSNHNLVGILDFDLCYVENKIYDIAIGMYKLGRQYKAGVGKEGEFDSLIVDRFFLFLTEYAKVNNISNKDIRLIPEVLFNVTARKICYILTKHYLHDDDSSDYDINKFANQLKEIKSLNSIFNKGACYESCPTD